MTLSGDAQRWFTLVTTFSVESPAERESVLGKKSLGSLRAAGPDAAQGRDSRELVCSYDGVNQPNDILFRHTAACQSISPKPFGLKPWQAWCPCKPDVHTHVVQSITKFSHFKLATYIRHLCCVCISCWRSPSKPEQLLCTSQLDTFLRRRFLNNKSHFS